MVILIISPPPAKVENENGTNGKPGACDFLHWIILQAQARECVAILWQMLRTANRTPVCGWSLSVIRVRWADSTCLKVLPLQDCQYCCAFINTEISNSSRYVMGICVLLGSFIPNTMFPCFVTAQHRCDSQFVQATPDCWRDFHKERTLRETYHTVLRTLTVI